jgi:hypothetical protein
LEESAGPVGAVCKKAMKPGGNRKHAHDIQGQTNDDCYHAHARPEDKQTGQVHQEELHAEVKNHLVLF